MVADLSAPPQLQTGGCLVDLKRSKVRRRITRGVAALALDQKIRAVQLDEQLWRRPGTAMQAVDILRDDREHLPGALERHDGDVKGVGPRALIDRPRFQLVVPVLGARGFRREKLVVVDGTPACPDAPRSAKVGNPAGR